MHIDVKKITTPALLLALALALNFIENLIPFFTALPGGKIGLANVVTMSVMVIYSPIAAILFGILRSFLTGLLSGGIMMTLYGGAGTILSVLSMWFFAELLRDKISFVGISIIGAFFFNVGQLAVGSIVVENINMFRYLPVLTIMSSFSGLATGIVCQRLFGGRSFCMK